MGFLFTRIGSVGVAYTYGSVEYVTESVIEISC
jgi:hypothetical protein